MKKRIWNEGWLFSKENKKIEELPVRKQGAWEKVTLPHTWNGKDGQDGGNDYYRGTCYYLKQLSQSELLDGQEVYLEFAGANASADVYVNGKSAGHHDGGYSTWRVNITNLLEGENEIVVAVSNASNDYVYPQNADFTFYGGLYRDVALIFAPKNRFDLDDNGSQAIRVTSEVHGNSANVQVEVALKGLNGREQLRYSLFEGEKLIGFEQCEAHESTMDFTIDKVHLWNGRKDPFLYTMQVELVDNEQVIDSRSVRFGCRTFAIDSEKGFYLNGESYPLRGVSRHQDRPEIGNALLPEHHKEDIELICEMGATTVRLAHYQQDQYFYDLCDEKGFIIWAEIPYISEHMPKGRDNTISQMTELIKQNYNHPCIVVWGISNEITMVGGSNEDLLENHRILNDLAHEMDKTRLTTVAVISTCSREEASYARIPDLVSYNLYFGWYGGKTSMTGPWLDKYHEDYPDQPIGISEYGCEALDWHTSDPQQGDYTEEYQAYYHEELIKQLYGRHYIWAAHVWNMFDFAADARAEGGENGMNHKGLVTFDRKYKKDAFYAYKAWLSDEPFVHICGKRYVDRVENDTKVTIYSNQPQVELWANGVSLGVQGTEDHFFYFKVPNTGETKLIAKAGECTDESTIRKVGEFNEAYRMKESGEVLNWYEISTPEGYLSINDTLETIMESEAGRQFMTMSMKQTMGENELPEEMNFLTNPTALQMLGSYTLKRMLSMGGTSPETQTSKEKMLMINAALNKIKK